MKKQKSLTRRVGLLDEVRGLCIAGVVVFHALYDLIYIYGMNIPLPGLPLIMSIIQPLGSGAFVFISGIVSRYSKNNLKRGFIALLLGTGISAVSVLFSPENAVRFGILSLLGSCMIICGVLQKLIPSYAHLTTATQKPIVLAIGMTVLFFVFYNLQFGFVGVWGYEVLTLPSSWYQNYYLYPLGLPSASFYSTDYFPLLPWLFLFLAGTFIGVYFKEGKAPEFFYKNYIQPLNWMGKHSMLIYILHQPVLLGVFWVIFKIVN